jgi:hypothetical protein
MHLPINFKSPNNISKWQVGFNSAFKGLIFLSSTESSKITKGKHIDKHVGRLAYGVLYIGTIVSGILQTLWTTTKMEAKFFSEIFACIH